MEMELHQGRSLHHSTHQFWSVHPDQMILMLLGLQSTPLPQLCPCKSRSQPNIKLKTYTSNGIKISTMLDLYLQTEYQSSITNQIK